MFQHDPRDVDVQAQELGLENGNTVQSTALHETMIDETETLDVIPTDIVQMLPDVHSSVKTEMRSCSR